MQRIMNPTGRVLIGVTLLFSASAARAQDWPQWRGLQRDAKIEGFTPPKVWPKSLTEKWTVPVGSGVSSPDLVGDKLYTFGRIDGDEVTICLNSADGKVVWQDKHSTKAVGGPAKGYGGPRSTPAVANGKVYTLGVNGTLSCLDTANGKPIWRKDTKEAPQFATSSSPLVADGKCIVFLNELAAYDADSGEMKWKGPAGTPYGSPTLMTVGGTKIIVTPTDSSLVGVSLTDGKVVWQVKLPGGGYNANYGTPIVDGQTVIYNAPARGSGGTSIAIKIEKDGDTFKAKQLWKSTAAYQYNTPVLRDDLLFGLSADKKFFCMDAKSGNVLWTDDTVRGEAGGVLSAGSVIVALTGPAVKGKGSEKGTGNSELVAFEPGKVGYKEIAKYKVSSSSGLAYPIVAGNRVYVKGNNELTLWTID